MSWLRPQRRWISAWLAGLLLFASWATASYACPRLDRAADDTAVAMAAMPGCDGTMAMDAEQPLRCQAHCTDDGKAVGSGSIALDLPPLLPALGAVVAVLDTGASQAAIAPPAADEGPPRGSPPIYLLLLTLRN